LKSCSLILRAASFAADRHRDQRRRSNEEVAYVNHPFAVACVLCDEGGVDDDELLAAALLHDMLEETATTQAELRKAFGPRIAQIVAEVSDDKRLSTAQRKRYQVVHAADVSLEAQQIKLADKLCNLRDVIASDPEAWPLFRKYQYFEWAKEIVDQVRGSNARLALLFDAAYADRHPLMPTRRGGFKGARRSSPPAAGSAGKPAGQ
jgi:guanosine-3',5'-bis(diphosphate) 3'-pyrophosphohydrolase